MASGSPNVTRGTVQSTGSAINVTTLGFKPRAVRFRNEHGDEMHWDDSMPAAAGFKRLAAGTGSYVTTNGVSVLVGTGPSPGNGVAVGAYGFIIGADTDVNRSSESDIHWEASE